MPFFSSSTQSSCSRSERGRAGLRALTIALLASALLAGGCGDDEEISQPSVEATPEPGGTLQIAVRGPIDIIDPLLAETRAEQIAARQIYEPLISRQNGPFGQTRRLPGLVRSFEPQRGATLWTARLRPGITFGDGELLDADAVKANAERWMTVAPGPELVPDLNFVDSPRPGLVRFFLDRPDQALGRTLAQARLGIVSPQAIAAAGAGPIGQDLSSGTGPFELREREGGRVLLARNSSWWGTLLGLGPGVDQIELLAAEDAALRAQQLEAGQIEVADELDSKTAAEVGSDPLLTTLRGRDGIIGIERSVRGIESAAADQSLADVWLTDLR